MPTYESSSPPEIRTPCPTRRALMGGVALSAALLGAGSLAACATNQPQVVTAAFQAFLQAINLNLVQIQPLLISAGAKLPASVLTYVQDAINATSALQQGMSLTAGQSILAQVVGDVNSVAAVVVPAVTTLDPRIGTTLGLIVAAMPAGAALVNLAIALSQSSLQLASSAPTPAAARARAVLGRPSAPTALDYMDELERRAGTQ